MKKVMLINVLQPEECRIAILENGVLEELYVERTSHESYVGNIYKGKIVNIEPSIQAAFVDFGVGRNGFLHVSDVEPSYYKHLEYGRDEGDSGRGRRNSGDEGDSGRGRRSSGGGGSGGGSGGGRDRGRPRQEHEAQPMVQREQNLPPEPFVQEEIIEKITALDMPVDLGFGANLDFDEPNQGNLRPGEDRENPPSMPSAPRITGEGEDDFEPSSPAPFADEDLVFSKPFPSGSAPVESTPQEDRGGREVFAQSEENPPQFDDAVQPISSPEGSPPASQEGPGRGNQEGREPGRRHEERSRGGDRDRGRDGGRDRGRDRGRDGDRDGGRDRGRDGGRRQGPREGSRDQGRSGAWGMSNGRIGRPKPLIQNVFRKGQEVLVQVIKEGIGTKGPTLSTYISIPGRYLVLMPGLNRVGVSRKITDEDQRRRLRDIFVDLKPPKGIGFIIRTAGIDRNKRELQRDLAYLCRLWQVVAKRIMSVKGPAEIYQESDMITRTIRDTFTSDINEIVVDESRSYEQAREFLQFVMPRYADRIKFHEGTMPLFHQYRLEEEIAKIHMKKIPLPMGGSIVIEQTEALVAIDVNSGNFRGENNAEDTAFKMNLQAAREIARQLRLRDLGGVIVNDFIDMREDKHRRAVEKAMRDAVARDRARTKILRISAFGIIEMTRQRIRPSLKRSVFHDCPYCKGMAQVKTPESMVIEAMRLMQVAAFREGIAQVDVRVANETADHLLNKKKGDLWKLEEGSGVTIVVRGEAGVPPELLEVVGRDKSGAEAFVFPVQEPSRKSDFQRKGRWSGR